MIANGLWRRGEKYLLRYNSTCQYDSLCWEWTEQPSNICQMEPVQYISYQTDLMNSDVPAGTHCSRTLIYIPYIHTLKYFFRAAALTEFRHEDSHISKEDLSNVQAAIFYQFGQNQVNGVL